MVYHQDMIKTLQSLLKIIPESTKARQEMPLQGQNIVFTGTLSQQTRLQAQKQAQDLGAKATNTVSKNTQYLVYGENPGSKFEKAQSLSIPCVSEEEWYALIAEHLSKSS